MMNPISYEPSEESIKLAEQIVIGSILFNGTVFTQAEKIISAENFSQEALAIIFNAMKELHHSNSPLDPMSVIEYLQSKGKLDKVGGPELIFYLCDNTGSSGQVQYYADKVMKAYIARQYARTCKTMALEAKQAAEGKQAFSEVLSNHLAELDKIAHLAIDSSQKIDWLAAKPDNVYQVLWPMGLHEWVHLFSKNIAVIGGSSNSGKTAFFLNVAYGNRLTHPVKYFSSEMGPEELRLRLQLFDYPLQDWEAVEFFDRSSNFAQAIDPDALNIIDYLEITDNFYQIGGEIKAIFDRLRSGIAVIGIQKKSGVDYARGGEFTLEKARLYLSIDFNVAKIIKGKNWGRRGNPNGVQFEFNLTRGCKFDLVAIKDQEGNYLT